MEDDWGMLLLPGMISHPPGVLISSDNFARVKWAMEARMTLLTFWNVPPHHDRQIPVQSVLLFSRQSRQFSLSFLPSDFCSEAQNSAGLAHSSRGAEISGSWALGISFPGLWPTCVNCPPFLFVSLRLLSKKHDGFSGCPRGQPEVGKKSRLVNKQGQRGAQACEVFLASDKAHSQGALLSAGERAIVFGFR